MKLIIDIPEEKYEWIKENNPHAKPDSIVGAVAYGTPYEARPLGEWIIRRDKRGKHIYSVCSKCNVAHLDTDFPNFCENCGSDNRKRGEAE